MTKRRRVVCVLLTLVLAVGVCFMHSPSKKATAAYYPAVREVEGMYYIIPKDCNHPEYGEIRTKDGLRFGNAGVIPGRSNKKVKAILATQESVSIKDDTLHHFRFEAYPTLTYYPVD